IIREAKKLSGFNDRERSIGSLRLIALVVWEGASRGSDDNTNKFVQLAQESGFRIEQILTLNAATERTRRWVSVTFLAGPNQKLSHARPRSVEGRLSSVSVLSTEPRPTKPRTARTPRRSQLTANANAPTPTITATTSSDMKSALSLNLHVSSILVSVHQCAGTQSGRVRE